MPGLRRLDGWEERLALMVEVARHTPFAWGRHDCALFAADVVERITGVDLAASYRGCYRSAEGAARALRRQGHGGLADAVAAALPEIQVARARRGDVVVVTAQGRPALGICLGAQAACAGPLGLTLLPMAVATRAWRV